jgi:YbgC/YbaW family acyl-CoA thioester hydrolase
MVVYEREVRFQDVDAAGLVYFPHFLSYAHEAMERLFDPLDGGYVRLIRARRIGLPAVRIDTQFFAPVRYGDRLSIESSVARLGNRSLTLHHRFVRQDGVLSAEAHHTVVSTDLDRARSCDMPDDVRRVAEAHLVQVVQAP